MSKPIIKSIAVCREVDCDADTSDLGEWTDKLEPGVIVRAFGEFYEKLPAPIERDANGRFYQKGEPENLPQRGREYRGFIPYAGGEKVGTRDYYKYGMQDYKRMEGLEKGDWCYTGLYATAVVTVQLNPNNPDDLKITRFRSGGIWGVESDSEDKYFEELMGEELDQLKRELEVYGVDMGNWGELIEGIEITDK